MEESACPSILLYHIVSSPSLPVGLSIIHIVLRGEREWIILFAVKIYEMNIIVTKFLRLINSIIYPFNRVVLNWSISFDCSLIFIECVFRIELQKE